jgi:D-alanyl-D-alanine carboxypeptidase (penicillin-binding protein 5/6)
MGAPLPCAAGVWFTVNGKTPVQRPLPAPASQVGGAELAAAGLHVTSSSALPPPSPKATAWLVADLGTGQVLAACNAHVPLAPASSLKVLTALALSPLVDPAARYTAHDQDARVDGTRVGLVPGSVYSADNLWHALLMSSANDAAVALGTLAGGLPAATSAMRRTAQALGAADTTPSNTSGLDEPGQVSSAYDLALFGRAALADAQLTKLIQTRSYAFPEAGTVLPGTRTATGAAARKTFQIQNHDRLLYNYPGALGVKNGWTSTTGGSFIGAAQRGNRRLIATVLAADPETWHMIAALLDWGFTATPAGAAGVGRLVDGPDPAGALAAPAPGQPGAAGPAPGPASARAGHGGAAGQDGSGAVAAASSTSGPLSRGALAAAAAVAMLIITAAAGALGRSARRRPGDRA